MTEVVNPKGGLVTVQELRELIGFWGERGLVAEPSHRQDWGGSGGSLQSTAYRVGLPDQPAWLTAGVWLDVLESIPRGDLDVQLVAGDVYDLPVWGNLRLIAQTRSHGWQLFLRRPGSTLAVQSPLAVLDTAELPQVIENFRQAWNTKDESIWAGEPAPLLSPRSSESIWEGFEAEGSHWRFGYFRSRPQFPLEHLSDLVDLAWQSEVSRIWLAPGPTLLFRGIGPQKVELWRNWARSRGLATRRSPWDAAVRTWGDAKLLTSARKRLTALLETADRLPAEGSLVLADEANSRGEGVFCPGQTLVVPLEDHWSWRSADQRTSGEGDDGDLLKHLFASRAANPSPQAAPAKVWEGDLKCADCFNLYSPRWGDPLGSVPPGVEFDKLPVNWTCPTCGGPKSAYFVDRVLASAS